MEHLEGRVAVITGAASGIGLAMAHRFAAEGMKLVLADIERPVLQRAGEALRGDGADVLTVPTDVSLEADVSALAATALEHFGDVHLVCNNAGVGSRGLPIADLPVRDFEWVLAVNLFGVVHGLRAFLPHLRANDVGHIVNTASASGLYHLPRMGPYNASKAAVVALSETLRFELAAEGSKVGVSVLCPSWVRTNISTSDRNRPERFAYALDTDQMAQLAEYKDRRRQLAQVAADPTDIAAQVCEAVKANRFYIVTHPASLGIFDARARRILAGDDPVEPPERLDM
ncbi:MAG TPA: SDR family NAD(P)-dependent oxidoreductase [Acidimicrobiales bacterium]|nr:SDR family NAD(P)-dependent oxidoreductase [Acidimicrobiales bacterium]